jgi:hypothetical protein
MLKFESTTANPSKALSAVSNARSSRKIIKEVKKHSLLYETWREKARQAGSCPKAKERHQKILKMAALNMQGDARADLMELIERAN